MLAQRDELGVRLRVQTVVVHDGPSADDQYAALTSSSKFAAPERGFAGTEGGARPRDGPVQFEADAPSDPFGLDKFLTDVKNKKS